jgi:CRISPR/Cas system-associated endonuclease/helicase Cas3
MDNSYITKIKNTARLIHDFIYNNIKLSDQEHATFIAGSLIALQDPKFQRDFKNDYYNQSDRFIEEMMAAIKYSIYNCKGFDKPEKGKNNYFKAVRDPEIAEQEVVKLKNAMRQRYNIYLAELKRAIDEYKEAYGIT